MLEEVQATHRWKGILGVLWLGDAFPTGLLDAKDKLHPTSNLFFWHF
jgi:hypothetical protein